MAAALRTQIYLSAEQRARVDALARREGTSLANVVRDAIDAYLERTAPDADAALAATFGTLPQLELPSRDEWDRA